MLLEEDEDEGLVVEALVYLHRKATISRTSMATFKRLTLTALVAERANVAIVVGHHRISLGLPLPKAFLT